MVFARLRGSWTRSGQFHIGHDLSATRCLCALSRSSSNTPLPQLGPGRRAVSSTITKNPNAAHNRKGQPERRKHSLTTLDPDRLLPDDLLDLSGSTAPRIWFHETNESGASEGPHAPIGNRIIYRLDPGKESSKTMTRANSRPFPDNTRGFLYFRRSPHPHPDAGEVRFRLVRPEDDGFSPAERFRRGSDLMNYKGLIPWRIHALNMIRQHSGLRKKLVEEGLVPQVAEKRNLSQRWFKASILDSITDPFVLHLGKYKQNLAILREESIFSGQVFFGCSHLYHKLGGKGTAWVRFEMSNLPCSQNPSGTAPRLVLRVLKFIEAPTLELPIPTAQIFKEGELIQSYDALSKRITGPWAMTRLFEERILTPSARKILEDTYLNRPSG